MIETAVPQFATRTYKVSFTSRDTPNAVSWDGVTPLIHDTPLDEFIDRKLSEGARFLFLRWHQNVDEVKFLEPLQA